MNRSVELIDVLPVRLQTARRYLLASGWRRLQAKDPATTNLPYEIYRSSVGGPVKAEIVLPTSDEAIDWQWRLRDAIQTLSDTEDREPGEVIQSIQRIGYDIVRMAIPSQQVHDDSIRLAAATEFISSMRGLLAATATTERKPLPYFGRQLKDSVQYADSCRFGHTYRGSFGFVVESPLPDPEPLPLLPEDPQIPFERRVIQRLARGIGAVVDATRTQELAPVTGGVPKGLSANGCEQLADLVERVNPSGLIFSFDLSPAWAVAREMDRSSFSVDLRHAEICRSAARELRRADISIPVRISGRVIRLQNQSDPTDLESRTGEHEVVVHWESADFGEILVRINVSPADYLAAVGAHGAGRPILLSGSLTRIGRQWYLRNPHEFAVIAQGELPLGDDVS